MNSRLIGDPKQIAPKSTILLIMHCFNQVSLKHLYYIATERGGIRNRIKAAVHFTLQMLRNVPFLLPINKKRRTRRALGNICSIEWSTGQIEVNGGQERIKEGKISWRLFYIGASIIWKEGRRRDRKLGGNKRPRREERGKGDWRPYAYLKTIAKD